ncbi:MAG TPA: hypothetical protein VND65_06220 [Candidatus Binatia bacterium]|nr:hypothetical protein [Candidatus Binatia bacterium]
MPEDFTENWEKLSELAAREEDPARLRQLIDRLCRILEIKQKQNDSARFGSKDKLG